MINCNQIRGNHGRNTNPKEIVSFKELLIVAMIETQTITQLLIEKGIITKEEYFMKLKEVQRQYEERQKNVVV